MGVTIAGTFSGLDVSSIISTLIAAESVPITNLQNQDTKLNTKSLALTALGSNLGNLSVALQGLAAPGLFNSQAATLSNTTIGTTTVGTGALPGTSEINVTQLATTTVLRSGEAGGVFSDSKLTTPPSASTSIGSVLNESDVDGQSFTINGKQIALSSSDTLGDVINKINASGANVTASYDDTTGNVSLSSSSPIVLGSAADTSDFLKQAELFNNGTSSVTSAVGLGRVSPDSDISTAGLRTAVNPGTFTVNGVSINYTSGESLNDLINSINGSSAGVTASYDTYEDQLVLSSSQRGPQTITVADGTSNIASALRLTTSDSALTVGQPTLFKMNGSSTVRQSDSNILTSSETGIPGVNFTATATGDTQVTIAPDVTSIANAINAFVSAYNTAQGAIAADTHVDPSDSTQNGVLAADSNLTFLAPQLRQITTAASGASSVIRMLNDLGVSTNANDNTLTNVDTTKLQDALTNNLSDVKALFNDPINGLTTTVQNVIASYNDSLSGALVNEEKDIQRQVTFNQVQITTMQERLNAEQTILQNEFAALDTAESKAKSLSGIISGTSSSSDSGALSSLGSIGSNSSSSSSG